MLRSTAAAAAAVRVVAQQREAEQCLMALVIDVRAHLHIHRDLSIVIFPLHLWLQ
jgi:hypothetical protein